ncbi:MAG: sulfurtransferase FdhD, partial [Verrucomicrobia bacterium]|nr:sulfurtransferase FdhD [Verrucomicrobiota bacterium]
MSKLFSKTDSPSPVDHCEVVRYAGNKASLHPNDPVVVEEPLEIRVQGRALVVTMRTPGQDHELAAGYLWSEGLIQHSNHILEMAHCQQGPHLDGNILNVFLSPDVELKDEEFNRFSYAASGCGLCGKSTIESIQTRFPPLKSALTIPVSVMHGLLNSLKERQLVFD